MVACQADAFAKAVAFAYADAFAYGDAFTEAVTFAEVRDQPGESDADGRRARQHRQPPQIGRAHV